MSDKELVELIRSAPWSDGFPYLKETADRIEELEAKLAEAKGWIEYHRDGRGINHNSFLFTAEIDRLLGEKQ